MRKTYRYKNLKYAVADDTQVVFSVEFISNGNTGQTGVNVPGPNDKDIVNSGSSMIGTGADLRSEKTICVSDVANLIPQEDEIVIHYKLNGDIIQIHSNPKSEEERPIIVLTIKFPTL
jgi:hypothetical protein